MSKDYIKFSDTLSGSIARLYRLGGLALVFVFVGVFSMVIGNLSKGAVSSWLFIVGAVVTLTSLGLFVYMQFQGPLKAARLIKENKETIDAIQEIGIEMTKAIGSLQAYTFKHIQQVDKILQTAVPLLTSIPFIGKQLDSLGLGEAENASKLIVKFGTSAEIIISDVEHSLVNADASKLKTYVGDLKQLTCNIKEALALN